MRQSRRSFFEVLAGGHADPELDPASHSGLWIAARGHEEYQAQAAQGAAAPRRPELPPGVKAIRISSNENPLGPGKAALDAITGKFPEAGRYPFNSSPADSALVQAIATRFSAKPENVVLGAGSQEILKSAVRAFTSPARALVTASPSFENCPGFARKLGHPVVDVKVDAAFRLDLDAMATAAKGAGLIFLNNPNNPTATVHGGKAIADFVQRVRAASPDTVILIDEAYHDYVTDTSYESAIPLALRTPNVFVTRTFSKAYGMAGMRVGYAIGQAHDSQATGAAEDAVQRQRLRRRGGDRGARRHQAHRSRTRAQHGSQNVHDEGPRRARLQVERFAGQLPVRGRRPTGGGIP